jgi:uracil-DNA glycosylase
VFQVTGPAPILLVGQAPGRRVHETGIPWNDPSGERLREWLGVDRAAFYDPTKFAILGTGLCYPGTDPGKGDRPPLPRCAPTWHPRFLVFLEPALRLRLFVGAYSIAYHLPEERRRPVGEVVREFRRFLARGIVPLPHPSPRNRRWLRDRPWFDAELVPELRLAVANALAATHPSRRDKP